MPFTLTLSLAALAIEAAFGYPPFVYRVIGHPVTWMGALLRVLENVLNRGNSFFERRLLGILALSLLLAPTALVSIAIEDVAPENLAGGLALAILASSLVAQRSLDQHVRAVADGLERSGLVEGRKAVSMIVGRNPETLDEAGVARAAIESLAENFSDGVVAPAFWIALGGLPGGALYKAANTADSMIGHKNERYAAFGWAAARFDDLINLPASRLAALWLTLAALVLPGASPRRAIKAIWRDATRHRSPNAGWPEAAMAGALGVKLAGPRVYGIELVEDAFMGDGRRDLTSADIRQALWLYRIACVIQWSVLFVILVLFTGRA
jgi:adenosylcobinamide-phosphate synthase